MNINRIYWRVFPSLFSRQRGASNNKTVELCSALHVYQFILYKNEVYWHMQLFELKTLHIYGGILHCRNKYNQTYCNLIRQPLKKCGPNTLLSLAVTINTYILVHVQNGQKRQKMAIEAFIIKPTPVIEKSETVAQHWADISTPNTQRPAVHVFWTALSLEGSCLGVAIKNRFQISFSLHIGAIGCTLNLLL